MGRPRWYEHAAFLLTSAIGFVAGCWHVSKPEESLLFQEHQLRALKPFINWYTSAGILMVMVSVIFFVVRAVSGANHISALWLSLTGAWMCATVCLIDMWRLKTLGEICGWDTAPRK